jgi:hypothetical protein
MITPEEWAKFEFENPLIKTGDFIAMIQKDAYNQAIEDVGKLKISSEAIYHAEKDQYEWDLDSLWCNYHEINKLKIK